MPQEEILKIVTSLHDNMAPANVSETLTPFFNSKLKLFDAYRHAYSNNMQSSFTKFLHASIMVAGGGANMHDAFDIATSVIFQNGFTTLQKQQVQSPTIVMQRLLTSLDFKSVHECKIKSSSDLQNLKQFLHTKLGFKINELASPAINIKNLFCNSSKSCYLCFMRDPEICECFLCGYGLINKVNVETLLHADKESVVVIEKTLKKKNKAYVGVFANISLKRTMSTSIQNALVKKQPKSESDLSVEF